MKLSKLLIGIIVVGISLTIYAGTPWFYGSPHRTPHGPKLSAHELFTNADVNGDNMLSKEEFENSPP